MKYILFLLCLTACSTDSPVMGPAHNYEVPTKTYVITEIDGDREIRWYSEDDSRSK
jgi:hypothetical protein